MTVIILVAVALAVGWFVFGQSADSRSTTWSPPHYEVTERPNMPDELAAGRLLFSEAQFYAEQPVPLVARVDQVFLSTGGLVVPVETKTRRAHRWYPYDAIELSVQAVVLRYSKKVRLPGAIASYGYVRVISDGRPPAYLKVPLLSEAEVTAIYRRYQDLRAGRVAPRPSHHPSLCSRCPQAARCPHPRKHLV